MVHRVSQDLSIAGKRAGFAGERSVLFLEQIRLIKELRDADIQRGRTGQFIRPRFMVWEQVPGAFSSSKGEDFRRVLEETIKIAEPDAPDVPLPPKGKWPLADCWMGDGWSVAYRVLDAQFWGVPQRRRRIALVADFGGHAAPEILFVRKGVCGDSPESGTPGEETTAGTGGGADPAVAMEVYDARGNGDGKTVCTLTGDHQDRVTDYTAIVMRKVSFGEYREGVGTITASANAKYSENIVVSGAVRRLTPLECERLQGYPDGWTDIGPWQKGDKHGKVRTVPCADSLRYRALGNSIALPPWTWVLKRLCACYERNATMASLFDGIGGFPLIWERLNGPGSCLWASEIEQFPIAVTNYHFKEQSS